MSPLRKPLVLIFWLFRPFSYKAKNLKISTLRKSPSGDLGVKDKNMTFRSGLLDKSFALITEKRYILLKINLRASKKYLRSIIIKTCNLCMFW